MTRFVPSRWDFRVWDLPNPTLKGGADIESSLTGLQAGNDALGYVKGLLTHPTRFVPSRWDFRVWDLPNPTTPPWKGGADIGSSLTGRQAGPVMMRSNI